MRLVLDSFDNYFLNESGDPARAALLIAYREALPLFSLFTVSSPGLKPLLEAELQAHLPADLREAAPVRVVGDPVETPAAARDFESWPHRMHPGRWGGQWRAWRELREHRAQRRVARQLVWFGNHGSAYATGGVTVRIGPGETGARYRLADVAAFLAWLGELAAHPEGSAAPPSRIATGPGTGCISCRCSASRTWCCCPPA